MAPSPIGEQGRMLLEATADVFRTTGKWPVWRFLDRLFDRRGLDAEAALRSLAPDLWAPISWLQPDSEIRLSVAGLGVTRHGRSAVTLFLDVLQWCVDQERLAAPGLPSQAEPLVVTSDQYLQWRHEHGHRPNKLIPHKAYQLLSVEWLLGSSSYNPVDGAWTAELDERFRQLRGVTSLRRYLSLRAITPGAHAPQTRPATNSDIAGRQHRTERGHRPNNPNTADLHPLIDDASGQLFADGHFSQAIFEAFKAVEIRVRELSQLDASGQDLMSRAFGGAAPPIVITSGSTIAAKDEQDGFRFLFMGAARGIRNPKAHSRVKQEDRPRTLEYLSFASLLMRRLDDATTASV